MNIREAMKNRLFFDGGMGTQLYMRGIGGDTELANLTAPDAIREIHLEYIAAGADIITANTFGAYGHKHDNAQELIEAALSLAKSVIESHDSRGKPIYLAHDMGPTGLMLEPYGVVSKDECKEIFSKSIHVGVENGADFILIETMMDINELELAVTAAKEANLPVMATMSFNESGRTMYGTSVKEMAETLTKLGVAALGLNCGFGPVGYKPMVKELLSLTDLPVILQPNAGLPEMVGGVPTYSLNPQDFATQMAEFAAEGVRLLGGCCGTSPGHIAAMIQACKNITEPGL